MDPREFESLENSPKNQDWKSSKKFDEILVKLSAI